MLLLATGASFVLGRRRVLAMVERPVDLQSLPGYYGWYTALWCLVPGFVVVLGWMGSAPWLLEGATLNASGIDLASRSEAEISLFMNNVKNLASGSIPSLPDDPALLAAAERYIELRGRGAAIASGFVALFAAAGFSYAFRRLRPNLAARNDVERVLRLTLMACSTLAVVITFGIVFSLLAETLQFFNRVSPIEFLFGTHWSPQTALRVDQVGSSGSFGAVPIFTGTLLITAIAMLVAVPIGLLSAIYMGFYASRRVRAVAKPLLEVLAGVPTVVYGFFAALAVGPVLRDVGSAIGLSVASESALAAGLIMGVMIIPFVSSLSDDAIAAVPDAMRNGSLGLGATESETIRSVILPAALPGIVNAFLLAASRAIGETMIVVMAAGLAANLTANPLEAVTTVTVQIVTLLTGDQEFDSAKTLSAFALGLVLFFVTLCLNLIALAVVRRFREEYE
ncbi:MAG: phosphate ABC transporter permease subunit PstC [Deltaproteobacteria bacterium]|nr:phosphate ABC transporter permease subunit PstC [Deltaproteobacteria bacterium]MBW2398527.1 phosphate ABC transporter permease subunit PstC [Deltaproteobacteria bacterium]MBW2665214.1 phosphate ABC transporter permease subunit PstC [Deltaproteobacteria bacterium]